MARAFILGHGTRVPGVDKTFVPAGKSISFYSNVDENTLRSNGLAALNAGDIPPVETFDAQNPEVDNYGLTRFEDSAIAEHMASESSLTGGKTYYIGLETSFGTTPLPSPVWLCTTPSDCARTKPNHAPSCKGLFALVPENELLSVTCRGVQLTQEERQQGKRNPRTTRLGARKVDESGHDTSEDFFSETSAEAKRLWQLSKTDPAGVIAHLESLSDPTRRDLFHNYTPLMTFAEEYYKKGGTGTPEAVLEARRALEALGEDSFADHVDTYGAKQKEMVLADNALKAAYDRSVEKRTKRASLSEEELDHEAIERQRAMREKSQHQIDDLEKRRKALLDLSKKEEDPYRIVAIWRMLAGIGESIKAAAQSFMGSTG
jgi:hypothetical protein